MILDTLSSILFSAIGAIVGLYLLRHIQKATITKTEGPDGELLLSLPKSPNHVTALDILVLVSRIALKHSFPSFTGYTAPLLRTGRSKDEQTFALPSLQIHGTLALDDADLHAFQTSLRREDDQEDQKDFSAQEIHPLFLLSQILSLVVHILASRACPIKPFGAVNTSNKIRCLQPAVLRDWSQLQTAAARGVLQYRVELRREGVRRKRGMEFCVTLAVRITGATAEENVTILEVDAFFLMFLPRGHPPRFIEGAADNGDGTTRPGNADESGPQEEAAAGPTEQFPLMMTPRDPHAWAATSKDYNPIHVSAVGAKIFGFPGVIAHGNHVVALALQQCSSTSQQQQQQQQQSTAETSLQLQLTRIVWQSSAPFELQMNFLRPVVLPAKLDVHLASRRRTTRVGASNEAAAPSVLGLHFMKNGKPYIAASVRDLPALPK